MNERVVLLFDLDCFYAQCERVRLRLPDDVCLAAFQWNSVLAVTYPARRRFGIQRGDSWDAVRSKSNGQCWCIHLNVIDSTTAPDANRHPSNEADFPDTSECPVEAAYNRIYRPLSTSADPSTADEHYQRLQHAENGRRRFPSEGKACLHRYRTASQRIFQLVLQSLSRRLSTTFVLERASIDEFYLDLTEYCRRQSANDQQRNNDSTIDHPPHSDTSDQTGSDSIDKADSTTVIVGTNTLADICAFPTAVTPMFRRACQVAEWIRSDVYTALGFTMSAGVSINKTMAKLAASYGKPNGQALLLPTYFPNVLQETKLHKMRNFGGKLGKQTANIFLRHRQNERPDGSSGDATDDDPSAITMGDISSLPLPTLERGLRCKRAARFVFDACRGIDTEAVKETTGALVKSITAFKSFTATSNATTIQRWVQLMATEIVARVDTDSRQNKRYPKVCTLHYIRHDPDSVRRSTDLPVKSARLAYPPVQCTDKVSELTKQAMERLTPIVTQQRVAIRRVGLAANSFDAAQGSRRHQPPQGMASIDTFFGKQKTCVVSPTQCQTMEGLGAPAESAGQFQKDCRPDGSTGAREEDSTQARRCCGKRAAVLAGTESPGSGRKRGLATSNMVQGTEQTRQSAMGSSDMAVARRLQAAYDREHYVLSTTEKYSRPKKQAKARRIDSFFAKR